MGHRLASMSTDGKTERWIALSKSDSLTEMAARVFLRILKM